MDPEKGGVPLPSSVPSNVVTPVPQPSDTSSPPPAPITPAAPAIGLSEASVVRLRFVFYIVVGFLVAWLLRNGLFGAVSHIPSVQDTCGDNFDCQSAAAVYRISFGMLLFFILFGVLSSPLMTCMAEMMCAIQARFWLLKTLLFAVLLVLPFLWTSRFFQGYAWVAAIGSGFFLLLQIIILLDFVYTWNDSWIKKEGKYWQWGLLGFLTLFYCAAIVLIVFIMLWFKSCGVGVAFGVVTIVATVVLSLLSLKLEHASLFPTSAVCLYCCWLCFSSLLSGGDDLTCSTMPSSNSRWSIYVQAVVAAFVLGYTTASSSSQKRAFTLDASADGNDETEDLNKLGTFTFAHVVMALASMYAAMLLTSWQVVYPWSGSGSLVDSGRISMWVKIVSQWLTFGLYAWTLIAPKVCTSRTF